jgi:hypothetical protein
VDELGQFWPRHATTSIVIFAAVYTMDATSVDPTYRAAAWFAAMVTAIYHALQPPNPAMWRGKFLGMELGPWASSFNMHGAAAVGRGNIPLLIAVNHIDRMCVCFISLYTGLYGSGCPVWLVLLICVVGGLGPMTNTMVVVGVAFAAAMRRAVSLASAGVLPLSEVVLIVGGCGIGSAIVVCAPKQEWPDPLRFVWHCSCAVVFRFGGVVNHV